MDPGVARLRVPPGRAGRIRLLRRLGTAQRAGSMLDHKLQILRQDQERLALLTQQTGEDWTRACATADHWLLRAGLLGGRRAVRLATDGQPAQIAIGWIDTMGVRYPGEADVSFPAGPVDTALAGTAALYLARKACEQALETATRHAAASAAERTIVAEVAATRLRLRAIENRWIPRLVAALAGLELALDETEHADAVRLRRAVGSAGARERSAT